MIIFSAQYITIRNSQFADQLGDWDIPWPPENKRETLMDLYDYIINEYGLGLYV